MSKLAKELIQLPAKELEQKVSELREELVQQKRARVAGELLNSQAIKKTRKSIAVALTLHRQARDASDNVTKGAN